MSKIKFTSVTRRGLMALHRLAQTNPAVLELIRETEGSRTRSEAEQGLAWIAQECGPQPVQITSTPFEPAVPPVPVTPAVEAPAVPI